ncbi:MAG TPA: response regulator transcription factor [Desulfuromonadaceae bacterium]|nr:response regulator transcription factor [Desulfuromonadaceae bacterium]
MNPASSPSPSNPISVCIVEDNRGTREGLAALLAQEAHLRCIATYHTAEAALEAIPAAKPDVALVDINLPGMNGIELVVKLKMKVPQLQILILTNYEESNLIFDALRAGASGYLLKKAVPDELIQAINDVYGGGSPMSFQVARKVVSFFRHLEQPAQKVPDAVQVLSTREQEILALLAKGYLIKEISDQLGIAFHTVRTHLRNIYDKLHVQSRSEAILKFLGRDTSPR